MFYEWKEKYVEARSVEGKDEEDISLASDHKSAIEV